MILETSKASHGEWVRIADAAPDDLSAVEVYVGGLRISGFVESGDVMVRCPQLPPGLHEVVVSGTPVGRLMVH
jgi:hypothetical protein